MSTTDPSAAKPDGFAIGSIRKRDRSGSGDEAAPVYPVKHPTMSYASAAKGRPAAQTVDELQQQNNIDEIEAELFLNEVKQGITAEFSSNLESAGLSSPQIINIKGDLANGTASIATDTVHAAVNTESTVAYNDQSSKGDTGHEKIEVVSSPAIKVETPDFLLSSSPGLDGFNLRNQFNKMYDGAYTTIDPIDQIVKKSFFIRGIIEELGVIGNSIPDFSDGMDKDLP
ncbi:hypothetical protein BB560_003790 [Smittium megazygosporum]|uniref:Uncharacterized protein n=1 Tax=Smittium megazygosporum TaxID=133381 RepID=A0A2T9ZB45_9FUNG|nr:hypothetical protein BB560_003790 [Smittium megazygosporum]